MHVITTLVAAMAPIKFMSQCSTRSRRGNKTKQRGTTSESLRAVVKRSGKRKKEREGGKWRVLGIDKVLF